MDDLVPRDEMRSSSEKADELDLDLPAFDDA